MDRYLRKYPGAKTLADELRKLASTDGVDMSEYLDPESLELADHMYAGRLYRSRDVRKTLRKIMQKESPGAEKIVWEMFCKRKIVFDSYLLKLSFARRFGRFKRFFVDGKSAEYRMQMMVHKLLYLKEDVAEEMEKTIVAVSADKAWVYLGLLGSALGRGAVAEIMSRVDIGLKPFVGSFLEREDYYDRMWEAILESPPKERPAIIASMDGVDETQFCGSLLRVWFSQDIGERGFSEFMEMMRLVKTGKRVKIEAIHGYLNGLIYQRRLAEFMKLFRQVRRAGVHGDGYELFEKLYKAICRYKRGRGLNLTGFLNRCKKKKKGMVSPYSWEDICNVYKE
ncbi:putative pentatricopeptide repeat protein [Encephalitozoon cuniculi]|nr:putative pentatricopeptide repeat protein [Encephalitozoon cuniculi]